MVNQSKILTVSYGTFSCTLEGFDDPFNTMKAIAEYFRDLAADDRYFGAEPPTPDAAMLHKIAEREIQRRVEAKIQDNGVILRAGEAAALAAPPAVAPVAPSYQPAPQPVVQAAPQPTPQPFAAKPAPTPAVTPQPAAQPAAQPYVALDGTVAAKLARIRAAVDRSRVAAPLAGSALADAIDDAEDAELDSPALYTHSFAASVADHDTPVPAPQPAAMPAAAAELADDIAAAAEPVATPDTVLAAEIAQPARFDADFLEDLPEAQPDSRPLADDLPEDQTPDATYSDAPEVDLAALMGALAADPAPTAPAVQLASELSDTPDIDLSGLDFNIPDLSGVDLTESEPTQTAAEAITAEAGDTPDLSAAETAPDSIFADDGLDVAAPVPVPYAASANVLASSTLDPDAAQTPPPDAPVQPTRARVIKVRRAQRTPEAAPDEAPDAAPAEAVGPAPVASAPVQAPVQAPSALSPEAEEDLARELAELETELAAPAVPVAPVRPSLVRPMRPQIDRAASRAPAATPDQLAEPVANTPADRSMVERRAALTHAPEGGDAAVARLLRQTNAEMEGTDTRRRASTIAHLKAAVAATVAERLAPKTSDGTGTPDRADPYRDDLAQAVRPRRPASAPSAVPYAPPPVHPMPRRPEGADRVPPLVLVSEQRIDTPAPAPDQVAPPAAVRPRRIATTALALEEDDTDTENIFDTDARFPDFARRLGATALPDLMEAAAAYLAVVEGRDSFTRPQLMRLVAGFLAASGDVSREDGLRSFGALLRDGRIEKTKRGQFAVSAHSRLVAEAGKLAG